MLVLSITVLAKVHKLLYKTEPQNSQGSLVCDINYVCYVTIKNQTFHLLRSIQVPINKVKSDFRKI